MRRGVIVAAIILSGVLVASLVIIWPALMTRYAPDFSERRLSSLPVGAIYADITNAIGRPLSFTVVAQPDPTNGYAPMYMKNFEQIPELGLRHDALLLLRYSEPRAGGIYCAVELILQDGKLLETKKYITDDD
jgi:hypothetical protein